MVHTYGPVAKIFDEFFEAQGNNIEKYYKENKSKQATLPIGISTEMNDLFDELLSVSNVNIFYIVIAQSYSSIL